MEVEGWLEGSWRMETYGWRVAGGCVEGGLEGSNLRLEAVSSENSK